MPSRLASSLAFGAAFALGVAIAAVTCGTNLQAGVNGETDSTCSYPRGCYIIPKSATECDDCRGGPDHCRLYFVPTPGMPNPLDLGGFFVPSGSDLGGTGWVLPDGGANGPMIVDQPVLCSLYGQVATIPADKQVLCSVPETLCVARGPLCSGQSFCVRAGKSCMSDTPFTPQHRPGTGGTDTYCPYTDDVCCPAMLPDGGDLGSGDAGDAGMGDAGMGDAGGDAGVLTDGATDAAPQG